MPWGAFRGRRWTVLRPLIERACDKRLSVAQCTSIQSKRMQRHHVSTRRDLRAQSQSILVGCFNYNAKCYEAFQAVPFVFKTFTEIHCNWRSHYECCPYNRGGESSQCHACQRHSNDGRQVPIYQQGINFSDRFHVDSDNFRIDSSLNTTAMALLCSRPFLL